MALVPRQFGSMVDGLFKARNPLVGAIAKWTTDPATKKGFQNFGKELGNSLASVGTTVANLVKAFQPLNAIIGAVLKGLASGIWLGFSETIKAISTAILTMTNLFSKFVGLIPGIGKGNTALKTTHDIFKAIGTVVGGATAILTTYKAAQLAVLAVTKTWEIATKTMTTAQTALDAVLDANPIGIAVIAITALVGGLILAYKHIKPFREAVDRLASSFKRAFSGNAQWEKDLGRQFKNLNKAFDNDAKAFQKKLRKWNTDLWNGLTGNAKWEKDLRKRFGDAKKDYDRYSKQQLKSEQIMQKERQKNWNNFWSGLSKKSRSTWNDMSKHASSGMQNLRSTIAKHSSSVSKTWDNTWSTMKRITVNAWQVIRQHSSNGMETVRGAI